MAARILDGRALATELRAGLAIRAAALRARGVVPRLRVVMIGEDDASLAYVAGMQRLAKLWTAPFPAYAPTFVKSARFGYFLSAMFAVGILLLVSLVAQLWVQRRREVGHF